MKRFLCLSVFDIRGQFSRHMYTENKAGRKETVQYMHVGGRGRAWGRNDRNLKAINGRVDKREGKRGGGGGSENDGNISYQYLPVERSRYRV